jgi:hypothetical protein
MPELHTLEEYQAHKPSRTISRVFISVSSLLIALLCYADLLTKPAQAETLTETEILKRHSSRPTPATFRIGVKVTNFKRKKINSKSFIWIMGKREPKSTYMFIDFDEPKDAKGLRFLFIIPEGVGAGPTKAFGYLPSTDVTAPLKVGSRSLDIGGTGLTIEDFKGFMLSENQSAKLLGEEKIGDYDCWKLGLGDASKGDRKRAWISKKDYLLVKSQELNGRGKVVREFLVKDFFTTSNGEKWARTEEVLLPKERTRIIVDQVAGVYNIEIPEQALDPKKFGLYDWRNLGS